MALFAQVPTAEAEGYTYAEPMALSFWHSSSVVNFRLLTAKE